MERILIELTEREFQLVAEALEELVYEYEHHVEPPTKRGGSKRERGGPDTTELVELVRKLARAHREQLGR